MQKIYTTVVQKRSHNMRNTGFPKGRCGSYMNGGCIVCVMRNARTAQHHGMTEKLGTDQLTNNAQPLSMQIKPAQSDKAKSPTSSWRRTASH